MAFLSLSLLLQLSLLPPMPISGFQISEDQAGDAGKNRNLPVGAVYFKSCSLSPVCLSPFTCQSSQIAPCSCPGLQSVGESAWSVHILPSWNQSLTSIHTKPGLQWLSLGEGRYLISISFLPITCTFQIAITIEIRWLFCTLLF